MATDHDVPQGVGPPLPALEKAMGQGAVRSHTDVRLCFRVRDRRDVDLVLGQTASRYGHMRPRLDRVSWDAMRAATHMPIPLPRSPDAAAPNNYDTGAPNDASPTPEAALWIALCAAPPQGWSIGDLIRITGIPRATLYRHLREYVEAHRASSRSRISITLAPRRGAAGWQG